MATGPNTPAAARATRHGGTPPKIIVTTAWVRAPLGFPRARAVPVQKPVRFVCACGGSAPRYACRGLATAVCRGVLASHAWLSFWTMSVSTDRDWPTSGQGHSCIAYSIVPIIVR